MPSKGSLILVVSAFAALVGFLGGVAPVSASGTEKVLYSFCSVSGCVDPETRPIGPGAPDLSGRN